MAPKMQNTDAYSAYVKSLEQRIVLLEEVNRALTEQGVEHNERMDRLEDRLSDLSREVVYKDDDYDY